MSKILKNYNEKNGIVGEVEMDDAINIILKSSILIKTLHIDKTNGDTFELRVKIGDSGGLFILALFAFGKKGFNIYKPAINKNIHEKLLVYSDLVNK